MGLFLLFFHESHPKYLRVSKSFANRLKLEDILTGAQKARSKRKRRH